jgi:hypothetical protein
MPQRFVETVNIDNKLIRKLESAELQEKLAQVPTPLRESILREGNSAIAGWEVPISKYGVINANNRNYPKELWDRVVSEQQHIWKGAPMLADHPAGDSDGSPQNICGVWLEARVGEPSPDGSGYVYGTLIPSGRLGEDLQDHLSKGLRAGTSSSGFGDLLSDGSTVDPRTFLIERLSDWVLTPSQGTYFTYEAATRETKNASDSERIGESANKLENVVKEKNTMGKLTKLEEKKFRKDMEIFLEDASKITDPQEQLREYEEILSYLEEGAIPDLREQIENKIEEKRTEIKTLLDESRKMREELGVEGVEDLKKKLTVIAEDTNLLKEENKDWKSVAKSLQQKLDTLREEMKARPTEAYTNHLKSKINRLHASLREKDELVAQKEVTLKETQKKNDTLVKQLEKKFGSSSSVVREQRELLEKKVSEIASLRKKVTEANAQAQRIAEEYTSYRKKMKELNTPKIAPSPSESIKKYMDFRETDKVESYWADLYLRHGREIEKFESKIRSAKTVREAMAMYMRILPLLNESQEIDAMRIPESSAISRKERAEMLERAGVEIEGTDLTDRLPQGWV